MSLIDAFPMRQISSISNPASLYAELITMILRLAQYGLIHGDFNEFNILIKEESNAESAGTEQKVSLTLTPILIDFPQMVSIDHANAEYYFDRDVNCIKRFFERRFRYTSDEMGPYFKNAKKLVGKDGVKRLDVSVEASGFSRKMAKELETYMKEMGVDGDGDPNAFRGDEESSDGEEEDEEEGDQYAQPEEEHSRRYIAPPHDATSHDSLRLKDSLGNDLPISKLQIIDSS
jgi:RIO kinase 2